MATTTDVRPAGRPAKKKDRTHYLYVAVIVAVALGIAVGLLFPDFAKQLKPLGTGFVGLIKMMIAPVIFCTIVLGIGSVRKASQVGKVGGIALVYFVTMSTLALGIGLVVGNIIHPGQGLHITPDVAEKAASAATAEKMTTADFLLHMIPTTLFSALTTEVVLQTLLVALLVGFALQAMGKSGEPILKGVGYLQKLVFRVLSMIMWVAPIGAFGAIAAVVGATGAAALKSLAVLMIGFYLACFVFVVVLPRLIAKMEHLGVSRSTVGVVVPTGYSFNLDGTAIYLTMASLFIATAMGDPLTVGEQISLLVFMMIASKGAAGVTGAGLATLAGGLASHRPELTDGVGLIVGIDRFMSEARAVTNFAGNAVATVVIGTWTKSIDSARVQEVLAGRDPFDETTMVDDEHGNEITTVDEDHSNELAPEATREE